MNDKHMDFEDCKSDDSGDDWDDTNDDVLLVKCLFCNEEIGGYDNAINHLKLTHSFDLPNLIKEYQLDDYSFRKLINYVRKNKLSPDELVSKKREEWDCNDYLTPIIQDDAWLMFDVEELEDELIGSTERTIDTIDEADELNSSLECLKKSNSYLVNAENGCITLSEKHFAELQRSIKLLKLKVKQRESAFQLAQEKIDQMQKKIKEIFSDDDCDLPKNQLTSDVVNDDGYFNTYSHFAIHHEMLTDTVRTESYRDALLTNSHIFKDCTMLDVGCGTGILSMFAAKSGCKKVISVDQSDVIYHAMDSVRENNLSDMIELKKGRLEDLDLGTDKVDAIVSEWMGYFLLFEGMLDTVIYARDHYLKPGGKLLPNRCTLSIVGSGDTKRYIDYVDYWSNVYGFKMTCMKAKVIKEPSIEISNINDIVTNVSLIQDFDLYTVNSDCINFTAPFEFTIKRTGSLTSIVGYFDVFFDLENPIHFSTGPHAQPTHWKQTVFSLSEPISITEGEIINGKLVCQRHPKNNRALIITIHIKNHSQTFYLD
ncbi:protein arginine N-methyltransferase 1 [Chelonus insularis]|uniref:protein arginine N-methyltransferase 1 n=1 Tax=Chelonus insularis TaxID=460826 RepID=UPI00158CBC04|nr:protein arginine N-methyltransferase 1 [Chelonus insularis]